VSFTGKWHTIPDAGINPLPVQKRIPIWFGGHAEAALRRAVRLGDGWMPNYRSVAEARPALDLIERELAAMGRPQAEFGLEPRLSYGAGDRQVWANWMREWRAAGATHMTFNTMGSGFKTPQEHIQAIQDFARFVAAGGL
jgi:alkanesulfonate monooxygenase SsuD/methylene tetrahydromethanopterin reductase-like flavin-dependent oxidoreductase (luciferase family)